MAGWNALDRTHSLRTFGAGWLALAAAFLLLPGAASAMPITVGEDDDTDCFDRSSAESTAFEDTTNGNFWGRRDVFAFNGSGCPFGAGLDGISVVAKTPFQLDGPDDIDGLAEFSILQDEMRALYPDFNESFGASFGVDGGMANLPPLIGPEGNFVAVRVCIEVNLPGSLSMTVASCLSGADTGDFGVVDLIDIGGGFMVYSNALGSGPFVCNTGECSEADVVNVVTLVHSNITDPTSNGEVPLPEMMVGWQFALTVPEPGLLALLVPGFAALAWRRRRSG